MVKAYGASAATLTLLEVAEVKLLLVKRSWKLVLGVAVRIRSVNVATPATATVSRAPAPMFAAEVSAEPAPTEAAVTVAVESATMFSYWSRISTTGWVDSTAPVTLATGWRVMLRWSAAANVTCRFAVAADAVTPLAEKVSW